MPRIEGLVVTLASVVAAACSSNTETSGTFGPSGGTLNTVNVRLDIPAGAVQSGTRASMRETQGPSGVVRRVEIGPNGLALAVQARVSIKDDGSQGPFKIVHAQSQQSLGRCCHDESWHQHSGELAHRDTVDLAHGASCTPACTAGEYCDDGVCRTPDAYCSQCGAACGPSGCDGWMCGCHDGMCGCHDCCDAGQCCSGDHCCVVDGGMCCGEMCCGDRHC